MRVQDQVTVTRAMKVIRGNGPATSGPGTMGRFSLRGLRRSTLAETRKMVIYTWDGRSQTKV